MDIGSGQQSTSSSSPSSNKIKSVDKFSIENILGLRRNIDIDEKSASSKEPTNSNSNFQYSHHSSTATNHGYYRNFLEFNAHFGFQGKSSKKYSIKYFKS